MEEINQDSDKDECAVQDLHHEDLDQKTLAADMKVIIVLVNFKNAYDCMDRDTLMEVE